MHGRGLNVPLIVKDYSLLKWIGANSYRTSHYPYSEEQMMLADREGILVIDEIPAVGLMFEDGEENIQTRLDLCKQQMKELVARDKNHPSVIMWSVANEPFPADLMRRFAGRRRKRRGGRSQRRRNGLFRGPVCPRPAASTPRARSRWSASWAGRSSGWTSAT